MLQSDKTAIRRHRPDTGDCQASSALLTDICAGDRVESNEITGSVILHAIVEVLSANRNVVDVPTGRGICGVVDRVEPESQPNRSRSPDKCSYICNHVVPLIVVNQVGLAEKLSPGSSIIGRQIDTRRIKAAALHKQEVVKTYRERSESSRHADRRGNQVSGVPRPGVVVTGSILTVIEGIGCGVASEKGSAYGVRTVP